VCWLAWESRTWEIKESCNWPRWDGVPHKGSGCVKLHKSQVARRSRSISVALSDDTAERGSDG